jgi:signal transduction histidine kinase
VTPGPRARLWLLDALLVAVAAGDAWLTAAGAEPFVVAASAVACLALVLRRRLPLLVFVVALPAVLFSGILVPSIAALYTLAERSRSRPLLVGYATAFAAASATPWPLTDFELEGGGTYTLVGFIYQLATAAAPVLLGQLVLARRDATDRLAEIEKAREHEHRLHAENVLARERARLAREMHDVVSHQVSLIAVQAGALQVKTPDPHAREAARTIRRLSVATLDELRHMVTVLRASGGRTTELAPQPTLADLRRLVADSGIDARLDGDLPPDLPAPVQRAVYRTVQEALTNVRKHAPGATATIRLALGGTTLEATITNTPPTRPVLPLPGAHHGHVGLRERAETLDGTFHAAPAADGGYTVSLRIPVPAAPAGHTREAG